MERADGGPAAYRYRPRAPHRFRAPGPLEEVAVYELADPPHCHLVTFGLTELHAKESPDRRLSGWGFELTFRVAGEEEPPLWAVDFLANLAAYVWTSGRTFSPGHHLDLSGPVRLDSDSAITAAMVVDDPGLDALAGPYGRVEFLQVVGLTADELELCRSWSTEGVEELLRRDEPLLVTRLDRVSVASDPRWHEEIARRSAADGSDLHELRVGSLRWRRRPGRGTLVEMGAGASSALGPALRRELVAGGASFSVVGDAGRLRFVVAEPAGWSCTRDGTELEVMVAPGDVGALAALFDGRTGWGRPPGCAGLSVRVVP
ncbi:MAG: suppressor of fused domain protein [Acidimicrobiales bacterium]